jgi:ABC-type branched-subunit amino acid transport system substrate-binding protein
MRRSGRLKATCGAGLALVVASIAVPSVALGSSSVPGLTSTQVNIGAIVTQSGAVAADFAPYLAGVNAYFDYVSKDLGGVNGRKIVLTNALDDASDPSTDITDARTLVTADHVFAIVGISTAFFSASTYLAKTNVPVFGYATQNVWAGPKNLFADGGSTVDFNSSVPDFAFVAHKTKSTRVAVVALNYPSSKDECQGAVKGLTTYGIKVVYSNLDEPIFNQTFSTDVTKIKSANANMVITCMDVNSSVLLSKTMQLDGYTPKAQMWLDGYDRNVLKNDAQYMKNTYFMLQHVPYEFAAANPSVFPGMTKYFQSMVKYGYSSNEYSDVALQGWEGANTFVEGLRAAGAHPTQASVVAAINKIKSDTAGGVVGPINWTIAHTKVTSPSCVSFVETSGTSTSSPSFVPAFNTGSDPWVCFALGRKANLDKPVAAPAGTPGA